MISGPTAVICDECVDLCTGILEEEHIPFGGGTSPPTVN
jgi:ATP-dependent protease Clp ATPase subunit